MSLKGKAALDGALVDNVLPSFSGFWDICSRVTIRHVGGWFSISPFKFAPGCRSPLLPSAQKGMCPAAQGLDSDDNMVLKPTKKAVTEPFQRMNEVCVPMAFVSFRIHKKPPSISQCFGCHQ